MDFDDDLTVQTTEVGSDELLSDDNLRLPDGANALVRLHAVRAWLRRRQKEIKISLGEAALQLQELQQSEMAGPPLRRRERELLNDRIQATQQSFTVRQQQLAAYEEAEETLEDCVNHTTVSERLLVEYYLTLENSIVQEDFSPRVQALLEILKRVEHVSTPREED